MAVRLAQREPNRAAVKIYTRLFSGNVFILSQELFYALAVLHRGCNIRDNYRGTIS